LLGLVPLVAAAQISQQLLPLLQAGGSNPVGGTLGQFTGVGRIRVIAFLPGLLPALRFFK